MEWTEPPLMEAGDPSPEIKYKADKLWCAYVCHNLEFPGWDSGASPDHPGFDEYCAVIQFEGVSDYKFGAPSDERLHGHPLARHGVDNYRFYKLSESPELKLPDGYFLYVATFHDETLQVIAQDAQVLNKRVDVDSPDEALEQCI